MSWMRDRKSAMTEQSSLAGTDTFVSWKTIYPAKFTTALVTGDSLGLEPDSDPALFVITPDTAGDGIGVAPGNPVITVGTPGTPVAHTIGTLDVQGDFDYYQVTLTAGQSYQIGMYSYAGGPSTVPLADPYLEVRTADGTTRGYEVVAADGGATTAPNNVNDGLDVLLTFEPTVSGVYYINARAFGNAGGPNGDEIGDYELFVNDMTNDPNIYRPYYETSSPLYSIDWGTHVNRVNDTVRNPDGNEGTRDTGNPQGTIPSTNPNIVAGKNVISVYFAVAGDVFISEDPSNPGLPPVLVSVGAADWEKDVVWTALGEFSKVADIVYVEVFDRDDADFIFTTYAGTPGPGISLLGSMSPPDYYDEGLAQFNSGDYRWTEQNLQQGGFSYVTLIHEFGHGHGLAHPHDTGGYSGEMRGVEGTIDGPAGEVPDPTGVWPNYTLGDYNLNQAVFTMMSYMDGWQDSPYGNAPTDAGYGYLGGLMAFDIAVIQDKYGVNEDWATGNDTYTLKDVNEAGTFYTSIWDAGGTDQIVYSGTRDTTIDLRPATLEYEFGGGGWVSFAYGIYGGFTVANGVTIENATSGAGNDKLIGNLVDNVLDGGAGNDSFYLQVGGNDNAIGGLGNDFFYLGAALTSADQANGGAGTDQMALQGNYAVTFGAGVFGIESLVLLPGSDIRFGDTAGNFYDYVLTTLDANVAAGQRLTVDANRLRPGEDFTFNGAAETDGNFFTVGGNGVDLVTGGAQSDTFLFGENGQFGASDVVNGGPGGSNDQLGLRGNYTITFGAGQLIGIESIALVSSQDTRFGPLGSVFNYNLTMNDGNVSAGQMMTVDAAPLRGGETLTFNGAAELNGAFRVAGGAGNDSIIGSAGGDILIARGGADTMTGGGGNAEFRYTETAYSTVAVHDSILDLTVGDLIDLSRIDANSNVAGNDAFAFIDGAAFHGVAGELRAFNTGGNNWTVQGDVNGDGSADFELLVTTGDGHILTGTGDFVL